MDVYLKNLKDLLSPLADVLTLDGVAVLSGRSAHNFGEAASKIVRIFKTNLFRNGANRV